MKTKTRNNFILAGGGFVFLAGTMASVAFSGALLAPDHPNSQFIIEKSCSVS